MYLFGRAVFLDLRGVFLDVFRGWIGSVMSSSLDSTIFLLVWLGVVLWRVRLGPEQFVELGGLPTILTSIPSSCTINSCSFFSKDCLVTRVVTSETFCRVEVAFCFVKPGAGLFWMFFDAGKMLVLFPMSVTAARDAGKCWSCFQCRSRPLWRFFRFGGELPFPWLCFLFCGQTFWIRMFRL